ncbi:hypothetical protein SDC9_54439 [bioreactor metagenome]|uniref:Uncharacterized protein n=1 Tax=bioreactor metagenome TaxID=1076179 RepID=A0A644WWQ2_9ZZZZ
MIHQLLRVVVGNLFFFRHGLRVSSTGKRFRRYGIRMLHNSGHGFLDFGQFRRKHDFFRFHSSGHLAVSRNYAAGFEDFHNLLRLFGRNRLFHLAPIFINHAGKKIKLQDSKLDAGFVLDLLLERVGKFGKALVCHDVQNINIPVLDALTVLIDAQAQAAPDLLTAGKRGLLIDQRTDLKHVRVIPSFFERGVGEDESQRTIKRQKPFLVAHNRIIGVVIGKAVAFRILVAAFLVL